MGGNAIKKVGVEPVRISKNAYNEVVRSVLSFLNSLEENDVKPCEAKETKTFDSKDSFGDLDVLLCFDEVFLRDKFEVIFNEFCNGSKFKYVKNGPVTSFVFLLKNEESFQIDINYVPKSEFEITYNYHGNGDLGNFLGRIFHGIGLKFGHDGLWYIHKNDTYVVGEILLSNDFSEILKVIGLDFKDVKFNNNNEVYDFVMSSPFFHPNYFSFELRNHEARMRDRKRPSYTAFLNYMDEFRFREKPLAGKDYAIVVVNYFNKMEDYINLIQKEAGRLATKAVLDATNVSNISGFKDVELGNLMKQLKSLESFNAEKVLHAGFYKSFNKLKELLKPAGVNGSELVRGLISEDSFEQFALAHNRLCSKQKWYQFWKLSYTMEDSRRLIEEFIKQGKSHPYYLTCNVCAYIIDDISKMLKK